jgi:hypothetical protein
MSPERIVWLADDFWQRVGEPEPFPRRLEGAIVWTLPVFVVRLRGLSLCAARRWLLRRGQRLPLAAADRPLRGCLLAQFDRGVIFLEEDLSPEEQRAILAHELGHYLAEYEGPRRRIQRRLGPSVLPVLDGRRPATTAEELGATLARVRLRAHVHFMERTFDPLCLQSLQRSERIANELACELLAPRQTVLECVRTEQVERSQERWQELLCRRFGLPGNWAAAYASQLLGAHRPRRTFTDALGL